MESCFSLLIWKYNNSSYEADWKIFAPPRSPEKVEPSLLDRFCILIRPPYKNKLQWKTSQC